MVLFMYKLEPGIWIWQNRYIYTYEYISAYVDNLSTASRVTTILIDTLEKNYKFKLNVMGPIPFHLGYHFFCDSYGILCFSLNKYIHKIVQNYIAMFDKNSKLHKSSRYPLEQGDNPELDTSELLDNKDTQKCQSLVGSLQWIITLVIFYICTHIMTISSFRYASYQSYIYQVKMIYTYLDKISNSWIWLLTEEPDYSALRDNKFD